MTRPRGPRKSPSRPQRAASRASSRFGGADSAVRLAWVRRILLAGTFLGMLACWKLWVTDRDFPVFPIASWYPVLPGPADRIFFGLLLGALVVAFRFPRPAVMVFLAGAVFLAFGDQNRFVSWFYLYVVLVFLTLFETQVALAACRVAVSAVYIWSGIQKFNQQFFDEVVPFFVEPIRSWLGPSGTAAVQALVGSAGVVELLIGLLLWTRPLRRAAIAATFAVHGTALLLLGPLGHRWNLSIWPWNVTMPILVLLLFGGSKIRRPVPDLRLSRPAFACVAAFALLPLLSFTGIWDSSLSFCLYSGNSARLELIVTPELEARLPPSILSFVERSGSGDRMINVMQWSIAALGAPPLAEPRNFRAIARYVARYAPTDHDVRLVIAPAYGPMKEYRQSELR